MSDSKSFQAHYQDLKAIAHQELARHQRNSMNTTALVHEAWIKLAHADLQEDPRHFRNQVALSMRHILVDAARRRHAHKRQALEAIETCAQEESKTAFDVLQIESLISWLSNVQPRMAETVTLRVFANMSADEIAEHQSLNVRSVRRDWLAAITLLRARSSVDENAESPETS